METRMKNQEREWKVQGGKAEREVEWEQEEESTQADPESEQGDLSQGLEAMIEGKFAQEKEKQKEEANSSACL